MATHEITLGFEWLYSVLSTDSTLQGYAPGGVYRSLAPPSTASPYVILIYQAGTDAVNFGGGRAYASMIYQVKAVGPASNTAGIMNAAARADGLITTGAQVSITGGTILSSFREQPLQIDELVNGEQWSNFGGLYRILVKAS